MKKQSLTKLSGLCLLIINLMMVNTVDARDLGVMGETYPIIEVDFLDFIQSRADLMIKNGQFNSLQERMKQSAIQHRDRPKPVVGITRTIQPKSWDFDPSIVLDHDVSTPDGKLIALAGMRINPLMTIALSKSLIFYNGDDVDQVNWALKQDKKLNGHSKFILVNGSMLDQEKKLKKPIYFDQAGKLTSRFGIKHVPAIVKQEGWKLRIMEVKI